MAVNLLSGYYNLNISFIFKHNDKLLHTPSNIMTMRILLLLPVLRQFCAQTLILGCTDFFPVSNANKSFFSKPPTHPPKVEYCSDEKMVFRIYVYPVMYARVGSDSLYKKENNGILNVNVSP